MSRVFISRLFVSAIKIMNLDTCIFSKKIMIALIFEINSNSILYSNGFDRIRYNDSTSSYCI